MVVDGIGRFIHVFFGVPGSAHDARVLQMSPLPSLIANGDILNGDRIVFNNTMIPQQIIADKAYAQSSNMLVSYKHREGLSAYERRRRRRYNMAHKRHRVIVENALGALKMRFKILNERVRLRKKNVGDIFFTCIIIHNFLLQTGAPLRPEADGIVEDETIHEVQDMTAAQEAASSDENELEDTEQDNTQGEAIR